MERTTRRSLRRGLGLLACAPALAGLAWAFACRLNPVRIGLALPVTGSLSAYGRSLQQGAQLAVEQINGAGGIQGRRLELVQADTGSDPAEAARAFQRLVVEDRVPAVVGGASTAECLAMAPLTDRYRRVLLSPSASGAAITQTGPFVFRNWPSDEIEGKTLAEFAAYTLHASRALVLVGHNPYAEGFQKAFCDRFEAEGRSCVTAALEPAGGARDQARALAGAAKAAEVLVLAGYAGDLLLALRELRTSADLPPVLAGSAVGEAAYLRDPALAGVVFARPSYDPDGDREASLFASAFVARYHEDPDIYAAHAYDAVRLVALAMTKAGPDAAGIRGALLAVRNYPGAAGSTTFDVNGDVIQPFQVCTVEKGRAVTLRSVVERVLPPLQQRVEARRIAR